MGYSFTTRNRNSHKQVAKYPIVPILIYYGFDEKLLNDTPHGWYKTRCDFHGEHQPSASYNTTVQAFNCHACGMSGDAIKIVRTMEPNLSFQEAKEKAEQITGDTVDNAADTGTLKVKRISGARLAEQLTL